MDAMAAIRETYFQECEEQLAELESGLLAIEDGDRDPERVNAVFRAVHSVKGGAGAFQLDELAHFAHVFENALDQVRAGRLAPEPRILKTMLRAADVLADLVRGARDSTTVDESRTHALIEELGKLAGASAPTPALSPVPEEDGSEEFVFQPIQVSVEALLGEFTGETSAERVFTIRFRPKPSLYAKANETALILRELARLGATIIVCDQANLPLLSELDPEGAYLTWTVELTTTAQESAIREVFEFVEWDCDLAIDERVAEASIEPVTETEPLPQPKVEPREIPAKKPQAENSAPVRPLTPNGETPVALPPRSTIRVDLERVDKLINLVGELVINQAMLAQRATEAGVVRSSSVAIGLDELEQLSREIQESVMAIRAQPVRPVFQRMSRITREVADATGKSVHLVTEGDATEVDKTVIECLVDPLTHMIRNAVDHGLEKAEARLAAGKPEEGVVRLSASHRSGRVVIEVADDGAGINRPRVRDIAVSRGLIAADDQLSDEDIDNLIFLPGFSTVATVTGISGRGVGMDVVKRSIQALGGRVFITSRPGQGSIFTMSLPLTLAVLDGMVVSVGEQTLVVPLTAIVETFRPVAGDIHSMGGDARVVAIRNLFLPLVDVGMELGYRTDPVDPLAGVCILVESEGARRSALLVDAIQGQRQVVIKSLEANYRHIRGIAAATILGDGRVALILDVDTFVTRSRTDTVNQRPMLAAAE